jgi:hypothetical protein
VLRIATIALSLWVGQACAQGSPPAPNAAAAPAEDPSRSAEIRSAMAGVMRDAEFERIALMSEEQRRKLWDYYRQGKAAGVKDAALGLGLATVVRGFAAVEDVRAFIAAYQASGKQSGRLPFPHLEFAAAVDKFPEAGRLLAKELESAQKMANEIVTIRGASAASLQRLNADSQRQAADAYRRAADGHRQAADPGQSAADVKKSVAAVETLLKEFK